VPDGQQLQRAAAVLEIYPAVSKTIWIPDNRAIADLARALGELTPGKQERDERTSP
jgi:hypothetical protein